MKVYKVVFWDGKQTTSYCVKGPAGVVYRPDEWTEAPVWLARKGYHLTAFARLRDAVSFAAGALNHQIWEAEAEDFVPLPPSLDNFELCRRKIIPVGPWPKGTVMARRIKLVRQINEEEVRKWKEDGNEGV